MLPKCYKTETQPSDSMSCCWRSRLPIHNAWFSVQLHLCLI